MSKIKPFDFFQKLEKSELNKILSTGSVYDNITMSDEYGDIIEVEYNGKTLCIPFEPEYYLTKDDVYSVHFRGKYYNKTIRSEGKIYQEVKQGGATFYVLVEIIYDADDIDSDEEFNNETSLLAASPIPTKRDITDTKANFLNNINPDFLKAQIFNAKYQDLPESQATNPAPVVSVKQEAATQSSASNFMNYLGSFIWGANAAVAASDPIPSNTEQANIEDNNEATYSAITHYSFNKNQNSITEEHLPGDNTTDE